MADSKTARASMRAGMIGEVKKDPFDTPEKKIAELRKQRECKLAVVRYDFIDALIAEFDKVQLLLAQEIANVVIRDQSIAALIEQRDALGVGQIELAHELSVTQKALNETWNPPRA